MKPVKQIIYSSIFSETNKGLPYHILLALKKKISKYTKKFQYDIDYRLDKIEFDSLSAPENIRGLTLYRNVIKVSLRGYRDGYDWVGHEHPTDAQVNSCKSWRKASSEEKK